MDFLLFGKFNKIPIVTITQIGDSRQPHIMQNSADFILKLHLSFSRRDSFMVKTVRQLEAASLIM